MRYLKNSRKGEKERKSEEKGKRKDLIKYFIIPIIVHEIVPLIGSTIATRINTC